MFSKRAVLGFVIGLGGAIALAASPTLASETMTHSPTPAEDADFHRIEQPLPVKLGVTLAGLGLVGLELWWFLWSGRSPSSNAKS